MTTGHTELARRLEDGPIHQFRDWPPGHIPIGRPGVYTIWRDSEFLYVGMSYVGRTATSNPQAKGVFGRLASHASGRRSGDQFCIYVCDRYVVPQLSTKDMRALTNGDRLLDARTRDYIHGHLCYRVEIVAAGDEARAQERLIRLEGLPNAGRPRINP